MEDKKPVVAPWRFNSPKHSNKKKGNALFIRMKNRQVRGAMRMNG